MSTDITESPRSLGRYELVHLLGQGGMGEVYLAKISGAAGFEKPCIVKTILPALLKDGQFLDRFHHEAKVLVHLVHSSIAQVYDMGEAHGTYYMALEYVAGVDVAYLADQARTQGQPIPVPVVLYLGQKVAEGLGYAHRKAGPDGTPLGIVHRDVSPHNVMVSYEGEVKVIDFGLAKSAARSKYTLPATVMGKLGYMSPEQARAEPLDHRTDIYSCGVMLWELLAGRPLIPHGTVGEMMAAMANPTVPALHELRPDVDPAVDAVVRRALAPLPQDRYARSDEFSRALNEQLLRASSSLGAEEVGNFVKALCPEAFSAQRKLISRISGVRSSPSSPLGTGVISAEGSGSAPPGGGAVTGLEATSVRPLNEMRDMDLEAPVRPRVSPLPGAPLPALAPEASPPAVFGPAVVAQAVSAHRAIAAPAPAPGFSRSKIAALGIGLVVLMVGTASTTVYFMRGQDSGPPPMAQGSGPHPPPHREPSPPGRPPPPEHGRPPPGHGGPDMGPSPGAPGMGVVGASGSAAPGSTVPAVGTTEPSSGDKPGETSPRAPSERPKPREPRPAAMWIRAKEVLPVITRGGRYVVPGAGRFGIKSDTEVQVVGPELNGKRRVLGSAKTVRAGRGMHLEVDEGVREARGDLFVVVPASSASPEPEDSAPPREAASPRPAQAPSRRLTLGVKRISLLGLGALNKGFLIHNGEGTILSKCTATVSGRRQHQFSLSKKDEDNKFRESYFKPHAEAPVIEEGRMIIECAEGRADLQIQG